MLAPRTRHHEPADLLADTTLNSGTTTVLVLALPALIEMRRNRSLPRHVFFAGPAREQRRVLDSRAGRPHAPDACVAHFAVLQRAHFASVTVTQQQQQQADVMSGAGCDVGGMHPAPCIVVVDERARLRPDNDRIDLGRRAVVEHGVSHFFRCPAPAAVAARKRAGLPDRCDGSALWDPTQYAAVLRYHAWFAEARLALSSGGNVAADGTVCRGGGAAQIWPRGVDLVRGWTRRNAQQQQQRQPAA